MEGLDDGELAGLTKVLDDLKIQEEELFGETVDDDPEGFNQRYVRYVKEIHKLLKKFDQEVKKLGDKKLVKLREELDKLAVAELNHRRELRDLVELANEELYKNESSRT